MNRKSVGLFLAGALLSSLLLPQIASALPLTPVMIGIIVSDMAALILWSQAPLSGRGWRRDMLTLALIGLGTVIQLGASLFYYRAQSAEARLEASIAAYRGILDITCSQGFLPSVVPPTGQIRIAQLLAGEAAGQAISPATRISGDPPGSAWNLAPPPGLAGVCTITNYGSRPLYDVRVPVTLSYLMEAGAGSGAYPNVDPVSVNQTYFGLEKIDPGPANSITFYLDNLSGFAAWIQIEGNFRARPFGSSETVEGTLTSVAASTPRVFGILPKNAQGPMLGAGQ